LGVRRTELAQIQRGLAIIFSTCPGSSFWQNRY
jgi:hypothetical protein